MLFEMATGNFNYKIDTGANDDALEGLAMLVNMLAEEFRENIFDSGYVTTNPGAHYLIQNTLVLNSDFTIKSISPGLIESLGYQPFELIDSKFAAVLSDESAFAWSLMHGLIGSTHDYHKIAQLTFKAKNGLLLPSFCTITRLLHSTKILISSVTMVVPDTLERDTAVRIAFPAPKPVKHYDARLIQRLHDFILANLDSPLPTVKELAVLLATNEHKLKDGFRHFFKTSIYQFYNEERLKRAHLLIQQTNVPLKTIAYMTGFNIYSNFSKAFKKRFSYAPNRLQRNDCDGHITGDTTE